MALFRETELGGRLTPFKGHWPLLDASCYVFSGAQIVGQVAIGAHSSVWHNSVLRGDVCHIQVGTRTNIQDGTVIHVTTNLYPTIIGDDVLVAHGVILHGCVLMDRAFVGMRATVMDNATIEPDAMLAAGSLLTPGKRVKRGELWAGSPAKFLRMLRAEEIEANAAMAEHYRRLAAQHLADHQNIAVEQPYPDENVRI